MRDSTVWVAILICVAAISVAPHRAIASEPDTAFDIRHQAGVRIGVWANNGDTPPARVEDGFGNVLETDINSANIYLEAFGAYRLFSRGLLEVSVGFANRGDVNLQDAGREYFGNLILYPMLVQFKYYLPQPASSFRPYVGIGGGIYYGRHSVQFTNDVYFTFNEASGTDLNYVLSGGVDMPVSNSIALGLDAKYMPIKFGKGLIEVTDYNALTVTFGFKYLFKSSGKSNDHTPRRRP